MAGVESSIREATYFDSQYETRPIPRELIETNRQLVGYQKSAVQENLADLVDPGNSSIGMKATSNR